MGLNVAILPVVTRDLPNSPRFTPYDFYRDASSALLQLVNQSFNFTYSRSHAFRYEKNPTNSDGKSRTHDFRTNSRCALTRPLGRLGHVVCILISLIADGPHHYHPACGHKGSSHLSPVHALQCFIAMQGQQSYNPSTNGSVC